MKVIFDKYEYFDPNSDNKNTYSGRNVGDKAFSRSKYQAYIDNRQYVDAANYLSLYRFKDPKVQREHENDIEILRSKGDAVSAIYGKISNKEDKANVELYANVFKDGGIDNLNTTSPTSPDYNQPAVDLINAKNNLGKHGKADYSDKIGIVFKPKKRTRLGLDWLAADNPYNIDAFYEKTGFTEKQLQNAGIEIIHKDDTTELKFSKSHPLANRILYNTPTESDIATDMMSTGNILKNLSGLVENVTAGLASLATPGRENPTDTSSFNSARAYAPLVVGYTKDNKQVFNFAGGIENHFMGQDLERFKSVIRRAERTSSDVMQSINLDKKAYTPTIMPWVSDELYQLKQTLNDDDYNKQAKIVAPNVFKALNSLGSGRYRMYSNFQNKEGDETLEELEGPVKHNLITLISAAKPSNLQVDAMSADGELGALVTVNAEKKASTGEITQERYQVFIPGLLVEEAQARLNRDTKSRAIMRLNNIIDWQYDYKTDDGRVISPAPDGMFYIDNELKSKDEALKEINRDVALTQMRRELKYEHTGPTGNLIKADEYEDEAKLASLRIAAELYEGRIGLIPDGTNRIIVNGDAYTIDDIFEHNIDMNNVNYDTYDMLNDIYSMYNTIMGDLTYYNR